MIKSIIFSALMCASAGVFAACLSDAQLAQLAQQETNYLSQKVPPVFKHALQKQAVSVVVKPLDVVDGCRAKLLVNVPQVDIDEANAFLDTQPAQKIMLNAQGYALPQTTSLEADFNVDVARLQVASADVLQTSSLGKLRASVELMYAFLTQKRAEIMQGQHNAEPWPAEAKQKVVSSCSAKQSERVCTCMADQYALIIPANQMEYIQYVRENPYALATGAGQSFDRIYKNAELVCKG